MTSIKNKSMLTPSIPSISSIPLINFIIVIAIFTFLSACTTPPSSVPFAVQKKGNVAEIEYQAREHRFYLFYLQLTFKEENPEDRERVKKLAGSSQKDQYGKLIQPGAPIALKLKIESIDNSLIKTIHDQEVSELTTTSYGKYFFDKRIAAISLKPGRYRFSVESLTDVPELDETSVVFLVGTDPKTSSIR